MLYASLASVLLSATAQTTEARGQRILYDRGASYRNEVSAARRTDIEQFTDVYMESDDPSPCKQVRKKEWNCTDQVTYEKAKNTPWYDVDARVERRVWKITSAYNSVPWQTDDSPCISASNEDICALYLHGDNTCAGDFPVGTRLRIDGVGDCTVRDRMHPRFHGTRIDIFMFDDVARARAWGLRKIQIEILN